MENENFIELIQRAYDAVNALPGFYKNYDEVLNSINRELEAQGAPSFSSNDFRIMLHSIFPGAKFIDNFTYDDKESGIHYEIKTVVKLLFPKKLPVLSVEQENKCKKQLSALLANYEKTDDGWYNKVKMATYIRAVGFSFAEYGFDKLTECLQSIYKDSYREETRIIDGKNVVFCTLPIESTAASDKDTARPEAKPVTNTEKNIKTSSKKKKKSAYDLLMEFAVFFDFTGAIEQLAEKALKEQWYYGEKNNGLPILKNYFLLTFERLLAEDAQHAHDRDWEPKILMNDEMAVFNTGLVDKLYEPIYAQFLINTSSKRSAKWWFSSFVTSTDMGHQKLTRTFGSRLPKPAHYYNQTSELVYDITAEIGSFNWEHFIDHCDRLPEDFLQDQGPDHYNWKRPHDKDFYRELAAAIKKDTRSYNRIKGRIEEAIKLALKRVHWNFKTAIPIYYPGQKQISLLLPLDLCDKGKADIALVLESTENGAYIAHTILTLQMAYTNARLITRPDSDWLTAQTISTSATENDSEDEDDNEEEEEILQPTYKEGETCLVEVDEDGHTHVGNVMINDKLGLKAGTAIVIKKISKNTIKTLSGKYAFFASLIDRNDEPSYKIGDECVIKVDELDNPHVGNIVLMYKMKENEGQSIVIKDIAPNSSKITSQYPYFAPVVELKKEALKPTVESDTVCEVEIDELGYAHVGNILLNQKMTFEAGQKISIAMIGENGLRHLNQKYPFYGIKIVPVTAEPLAQSYSEGQEATVEIDEEGNMHIGNLLINKAVNAQVGQRVIVRKVVKNVQLSLAEKYPFYASFIELLQASPTYAEGDDCIVEIDDAENAHIGNILLNKMFANKPGLKVKLKSLSKNTIKGLSERYPYYANYVEQVIEDGVEPSYQCGDQCVIEIDDKGLTHAGNILLNIKFDNPQGQSIILGEVRRNLTDTVSDYPFFAKYYNRVWTDANARGDEEPSQTTDDAEA